MSDPDPELVMTGLDVRDYRAANDEERQQLVAAWLKRSAEANLSDDESDKGLH